MTRPVRWLHLSDLHYGCPGKELWEQVEEEFLRDLEGLVQRLGPPDLLLFTGDLAYSGKEYDEVDAFLERLGARFEKIGAPEPLLVAVPGNHDVVRPEGRAARSYRPLRSFDGTVDDPEVAEIYKELWEERDAAYIDELFPRYRSWFERRVRPRLETEAQTLHRSHFPCDFTAVVEPEGAFPLALVGLNSTWLHYARDFEAEGKLLIPIQQLRAALAPPEESEPYAVFRETARALLLMHHPPEWLSPQARKEFDAEIYHPERFAGCLFGHLHRANSTEERRAGGPARVFVQSPSLFGLKRWGRREEGRTFGYSLGALTEDGELRLWPRKAERRNDGTWSFGHDDGFADDPEGRGLLIRRGESTAAGEALARRGIERRGYLSKLIERTETMEIRGIAGRYRSEAIAPPIEGLYTPLRMRAGAAPPAGLEGGAEAEATDGGAGEPGLREVGSEALQKALERSDRVLIEGEAGAGKTTFLRLVASMLARDADGRSCPGGTSWTERHLGLDLPERPLPVFLRLAGLVPLLTGASGPDDRGRLLELLASDLKAQELEGDERGRGVPLGGRGAWESPGSWAEQLQTPNRPEDRRSLAPKYQAPPRRGRALPFSSSSRHHSHTFPARSRCPKGPAPRG